MSVLKAPNGAIHLKYTTSDPIPLESIVKSLESLGLSSEIRLLYRHIAEVVCNIYNHASPEANKNTDWSFSVRGDSELLIVTINDHGQGINRSIAPLFNKPVSPLESLNLAVNRHRSRCHPETSHRGQGLKGIVDAVTAGGLISFHIESDGYQLSCLQKTRSIKKIQKVTGTKVQLVAGSDGGAK